MVDASPPDTAKLLDQAAEGSRSAVEQLLDRHRERLLRMVRVRLDRRLAARLDASDVVQDALADAARKLPGYLQVRPLPFYPWLRQLAWEKLVYQHRRHLHAARRSVSREASPELELSDQSAVELVRRLVERSGHQPGERMLREELRARVRDVLQRLRPGDREVLVLRYLEELSTQEMACVLGLTPDGVKTRQRRALERFSALLSGTSGDQ